MKQRLSLFNLSRCLLLLFIAQNAIGQSFILQGVVSRKDTGIVLLTFRNNHNDAVTDIAIIRHGRFQFQDTILNAEYALLQTDTNYVYGDNTFSTHLFIHPGFQTIKFNYGLLKNAIVTGSSIQQEYQLWNKRQSIEVTKLKRLAFCSDSIRKLLRSGSINASAAEHALAEIDKRYRPLWNKLRTMDARYINQNRNSFVAAQLLNYCVGTIPDQVIDTLYNNLAWNVKSSSIGMGFLDYYSNYKKAIGQEYPFNKILLNSDAPAFTLYKTSPDSLTVKSFKGTVTVLEFWGLSCIPCLQLNPEIEKIRQRYKKGQLKVIAINSCDIKEYSQFIAYIKKNRLTEWFHVSGSFGSEKRFEPVLKADFRNYYSLEVPKTIIIDAEGQIIYKNVGYSSEALQHMEDILQNAIGENKK